MYVLSFFAESTVIRDHSFYYCVQSTLFIYVTRVPCVMARLGDGPRPFTLDAVHVPDTSAMWAHREGRNTSGVMVMSRYVVII